MGGCFNLIDRRIYLLSGTANRMSEESGIASVFYYGHSLSDRKGPVTQKELKELAAARLIDPTDRVWQGDSEKSAQAGNIKGLFPANPIAPAPLQTMRDPANAEHTLGENYYSRVHPMTHGSSTTSYDMSSPSRPLLDARPLVPRKADGLFAKIEQMRDDLHKIASEQMAARGIVGNVLRSHPLVHPCWVSIEFWQPVDNDPLLTQRSTAVVRIEAKPYHRHEFEFELELNCRGRIKKSGALAEFGAKEISRTMAYLMGETMVPTFSDVQLRRYPWELWKRRNKPEALAKDWLAMIPIACFALGFLTLGAYGFGLLLMIAGGVVAFLLQRRPKVVRTSGKPIGEPRNLLCLDSWQTMVFSAGATCEDVRSRLSNRFEKPFSDLMRFRPEQIWYWGLDGVTEREQFVITHGRAIAFVHVHRYGNDLYVAWDGHLNRGQWVEKDLYQGVDKRSGRLAVIRVVEAGYQRLTEYDLTDANSLMEWVHAQVVQVIKQIMVEQKIDQEIDFKVIRGERQGVTSGEGSARETIGRIADKAKNMLKRVG